MRIIDKRETMSWLSERGLLDPRGKLLLSRFLAPIHLRIPSDSGKKTALSKVIASFCDATDEALLWINEFGIWPSSEDRHLFEGFRRSLGEDRPLHEKPGHLFSGEDLDAVGSLLALVLYFCWGAVFISTARGVVITISHDEIIDVFVKDQKDIPDIKERLDRLLSS